MAPVPADEHIGLSEVSTYHGAEEDAASVAKPGLDVQHKDIDVVAQVAGGMAEEFDAALTRKVRWKIDCWVLPLLSYVLPVASTRLIEFLPAHILRSLDLLQVCNFWTSRH